MGTHTHKRPLRSVILCEKISKEEKTISNSGIKGYLITECMFDYSLMMTYESSTLQTTH